MEALSLLRYWRSNGVDGTSKANVTTATTIVTGVSTQTSETGDEENDHGPFFDLEFSLPAEGDEELEKNNGSDYGEEEEEEEEEEDSDGSEKELKFTLLSGSSGDSTADLNVSVSPSDDLFFKGGFVPVDHSTETNSKHPPQFRLSLMKSATKFRVMMLKLRKSKLKAEMSEGTESNASGCSTSKEEEHKKNESRDSGKAMTVKLKVEQVPSISLFKRHNSSKKQQNENESVSASSDEKKFSAETMQRYFKKVKPLYVRVSKKYSDKLKFTGVSKLNIVPPSKTEEQKQSPAAGENESTSEPPLLLSTAKGLKQGNLPAGLRVVCKHFGKTWSASTPPTAPPVTISSKRRDDSLLQQQDGIQSAILHCKRSFKASRDSDCSSSDPAAQSGKCENISSSDEAVGKEAEDDINKK